ncbi:MAG TPA: hypothetical protein VGN89_05360 [Phenylobacterium sp.]|nr:hypothetical protein [Phenylobacterium sp.]
MTAFTERWHEYLRASKAQERTFIGVLTRGAPASAALQGVVQRRLAHHTGAGEDKHLRLRRGG